MGSIAAYILRHGRAVLAWGIFISGAAVFYAALDRYNAFSYISSSFSSALSLMGTTVSMIPASVSNFNQAIVDALDDSNGLAQLLFWLAGLDVAQSIFTYIIAQINTIVTAVVFVGTSSIVFAGFVFTVRKVQRWVRASSGGDLNVDLVD